MLEYFWVLAEEHWGGQDQYKSKDDNSCIDLHYWWLLSVWCFEIVGQEFEEHIGEDSWVNILNAHAEVNLEEWHPPGSGFWSLSGQAGNTHGKLVYTAHEDLIEPGDGSHTGNLEGHVAGHQGGQDHNGDSNILVLLEAEMSVETDGDDWDPEGGSNPLNGFSVSVTSGLGGLMLELPSNTNALKKTNWDDQVVSNVVLDHVEKHPAEVGGEGGSDADTEHADDGGAEGSLGE